ncbi:30S ribosomal protein S7 [Candidatus Collierbacteria bacterium]|nr:30S ribosomal protein S7 [Candidatus Collierbacteria bacterium]
MRSKNTPHRTIVPDLKYNSLLVSKLINRLMYDGKKNVAASQAYQALAKIKAEAKTDELTYLNQAIENIKPQIEVRSRRIGGASYQVPTPVRNERKETLAIRWLVTSARAKPNSQYHTLADKLAAEITEAHENQGNSIKKKLEIHRQAEANKAFSHFRW